MKKIIGIVLAAVIVVGGLGGFVFAQGEPVNEVTATSRCFWLYDVPGDTFDNDEVTGYKSWQSYTINQPDITGEPVTALQVSLESDAEFDYISLEPDMMGPPHYMWSLGDIAEESSAEVFVLDQTAPSHFTPGFDAYCSADNTVFSAPATQRITIELTPRDTTEGFHLHVGAWEDELVNPVITSVTSEDEILFDLSSDGHWLDINPVGLELGVIWTATVTISVTPKVAQVEFAPFVDISWDEEIDSGIITGDSVSYRAGEAENPIGTWTWSGDGGYIWHWEEVICRSVRWLPYSRDLGNHVYVSFATNSIYAVPGNTFINQQVTGSAEWGLPIINVADETGEPVTELTATLNSQLEFDRAGDVPPMIVGPPTYEWSFDELPEGDLVGLGVRFMNPDPFPVTFTPGFDASMTLDKTEFLQSEGTQTQTVTISVTPREQPSDSWIVVVGADDAYKAPDEYDLVDAVIPTAGDGHKLLLFPTGLVLDQEWTTTVEIQVMPKVPRLEFKPCVQIFRSSDGIFGGTTVGSSVSHPADEVGTWTVRAEGSYVWNWDEGSNEAVEWQACYGDLSNHVGVDFFSNGLYAVSGDTFTNHEVTGSSEWAALLVNHADDTGAPVDTSTLTLDSALEYDRVQNGHLVTEGPPTYEWSFDALPQGSQAYENVRFLTPDPFPVTFTPGFDASRTLDKTVFLQSDGTQTQTLTITLTPREAELLGEDHGWFIVVAADEEYAAPDENDVVEAVITSPSGDEHLNIIGVTGLELGQEWTTIIEIQVTPKVPQVEFIPSVRIGCFEYLPFDTSVGSSVSYLTDGVGTWTWITEGSYSWYWQEVLGRYLEWQSSYGEGIEDFAVEHMFINFDRRPRLDEIVGKASFQLDEDATYDLAVDDVTVNIDGVDITIPAGSFRRRIFLGGERYVYNSPWWVKPKIVMELDFEDGEWRLLVHDIDASAINSYDGVDVSFCIGYMATKESIDMSIGGLSYIAED
jgi:hypothetical protein